MSSSNFEGNLSALLYAFSVVFSILPTIAVAMRFQVRLRSRARLVWEDWTMLISWVSCIVVAILIIIGTAAGGMGRPLRRDENGKPIYDGRYFIFQKVNYGIDLAQLLALGPAKLSVLFLYRRIFGTDGRRFNTISLVLIMLVIGWTVSFFITNALQYSPASDMWTKPPSQAHPRFKNSTQMFLAQSYFDVAFDVLIITLPIPLVWKLQMSLHKKLQTSAVFLLGAITTGASIARTVVQYGVAREFDSGNVDKTYFLAPIAYWPLIEASLGIVAASLPLLRPIGQMYSIRNLFLVSSKAISAVFSVSSHRSQKSNPTHHSLESGIHDVHGDHSTSDNWFKPYDLSVLYPTVDNESQIESIPLPISSSAGNVGDGIKYERGYEVSVEGRKGPQ